MKLIIVRHGETEGNVKRIITGQTETSLTEQGRTQARRLGVRLAKESPSGIFSSDLGRARETTSLILEACSALTPVFDPLLRERSRGEFEGKGVQEYDEALAGHSGDIWDFHPAGGETILMVRQRARKFLDSLEQFSPNGSYIVSAHHSINKALICELLNHDNSKWRSLEQRNTCVNIFNLNAGNAEMVCINCVEHLAT